MAYQQPIYVLMESEQPDQDNNADTENQLRSSIRTLQFVHKGSFVSISDSDLDTIAYCCLKPHLICFTSDLHGNP